MNLTVFGASGGVGREIVAQAVAAGHCVRAVIRSGAAIAFDPRVETLVIDDLSKRESVAEAVRGAQGVLSALGLRRRNPNNPWSPTISPTDLTSQFARTVVDVLPKETASARLIVVSAAGVGDSRPAMSGMLRWMFDHSNIGVAYKDLDAMETVLRNSSLDWMAVRPVTLANGRRRGRPRTISAYGLMDRIARADVAAYMLESLAVPHLAHRTPMIA